MCFLTTPVSLRLVRVYKKFTPNEANARKSRRLCHNPAVTPVSRIYILLSLVILSVNSYNAYDFPVCC